MKLLVNQSPARVQRCFEMWPQGVLGQLITPISRGTWARPFPFAIDNGCFARFYEDRYISLLERNRRFARYCLFVAIPDKVGDHQETLRLWKEYKGLAHGYRTAFVAQDGYDGMPASAQALFIGGTDEFKDSHTAILAVRQAKARGLHVHVGRVNTVARLVRFANAGADSCDGSGVAIYDHIFHKLREDSLHYRLPYPRNDWITD